MSDEMIELPEGWELISLGDVIELKYGKSLTKSKRDGGEYPVYGSNGIVGFHSNCIVNHSCLIVGRKGSIGEIHTSKNPCYPIDTTYYIDEFYEQPINFWFYRLKALPLEQLNRASAVPGLNREDAYKLLVALPPLNEQCRIVSKIEALRARSQRVTEALEAIPPLLNQFRQSVLAAAFRGDLTADWREKNPDVEPASVLLEKIRAERRQCWENHLLSQEKNPKKAKYHDAAPIEAENLSELPDNWCWITLGDVAWSVKDGPHFSPKYSENGIPFISGGNVHPDVIDFTNVKYISPELHKELSQRCVPEIGDILYTKGGTTGIARVNTYNQSFNVWVHVAVIKCVPSIERFYLQHALNSPDCYEQSQKFTHGVGNQDLGLTRMVKITIPLAPLKEQKLIIQRINQYMDTIKKLAKLIDNVQEQSESINQSILAKAFRGELVLQDPNDEPASILLERIRAERDKLQASAKTAKKSTSKTGGQRSQKAKQQDTESVQLELPVME